MYHNDKNLPMFMRTFTGSHTHRKSYHDPFTFDKVPEDRTHRFAGLPEIFEEPSREAKSNRNQREPMGQPYRRSPFPGFDRKMVNPYYTTERMLKAQTYIDGVSKVSGAAHKDVQDQQESKSISEIDTQLDNLSEIAKQVLADSTIDDVQKEIVMGKIKENVKRLNGQKDALMRASNPNYKVEQGIEELVNLFKGFSRSVPSLRQERAGPGSARVRRKPLVGGAVEEEKEEKEFEEKEEEVVATKIPIGTTFVDKFAADIEDEEEGELRVAVGIMDNLFNTYGVHLDTVELETIYDVTAVKMRDILENEALNVEFKVEELYRLLDVVRSELIEKTEIDVERHGEGEEEKDENPLLVEHAEFVNRIEDMTRRLAAILTPDSRKYYTSEYIDEYKEMVKVMEMAPTIENLELLQAFILNHESVIDNLAEAQQQQAQAAEMEEKGGAEEKAAVDLETFISLGADQQSAVLFGKVEKIGSLDDIKGFTEFIKSSNPGAVEQFKYVPDVGFVGFPTAKSSSPAKPGLGTFYDKIDDFLRERLPTNDKQRGLTSNEIKTMVELMLESEMFITKVSDAKDFRTARIVRFVKALEQFADTSGRDPNLTSVDVLEIIKMNNIKKMVTAMNTRTVKNNR